MTTVGGGAIPKNIVNDEPVNISKLPGELFGHILEYLPPEDLENCLEVNQQWRNNANYSEAWGRHLKKFAVQDEGDKTELAGPPYENLCRNARIWFAFRKSKAYKWLTNTGNSYDFKISLDKQKVYCNVVLMYTDNQHKFIERMCKLSQPNKRYNLNPIPMDCHFLTCGKKYVIFNRKYIVEIYKFEGSELKFHMAIDTRISYPHVINDYDQKRITVRDDAINPDLAIIFGYHENRMILQKFRYANRIWDKYWIDLNNKKISAMNLDGRVFRITKSYLIIDRGYSSYVLPPFTSNLFRNLKCYDIDDKGYVIGERTEEDSDGEEFSLERSLGKPIIGQFTHIFINNTLLMGFTLTKHANFFDLKTGNLLSSRKTSSEWFTETLHPSLEIVYAIEKEHIKAICPRTGQTIWENLEMRTSILMGLKIISERYLLVYYSMDFLSHEGVICYFLDAKRGNKMFKVIRPSGSVKYITEDYLLINKYCKPHYLVTYNE